MSRTIGFLTACVILAVIQAALVALVVILLLGLLISFVIRPRETLAFLGALAAMALVSAHPLACILAAGMISITVVIVGALTRRRQPLLLTDGRKASPSNPNRLNLLR